MNLKSLNFNNSKGFSLIELILSLALFVVSIASIAHLFVGARSTAFYSLNKAQASFLAKEGIEEQRALSRQDGVRNLDDKTETITLDGKDFQREIDVSFLTRNRAKVTSTVTQTSLGQDDELSFSEVLTTWSNIEYSLEFDGVDDYISISNYYYNSSQLSAISVLSWIKPTGDGIIISFDRNEYWRFEIGGNAASSGHVGMSFDGDGGQVDNFGSSTDVVNGEWHQVAFVFDNGNAYLYVDGNQENNISSGSYIGTGGVRYGFLGVGSEAESFDGTTGPDTYFPGRIAETRIYHRALNQEEIEEIYSGKNITNGLVGYWSLNESQGCTAFDESGNANDGTLMPNCPDNSPTWKFRE